jgi:hypothetical protein
MMTYTREGPARYRTGGRGGKMTGRRQKMIVGVECQNGRGQGRFEECLRCAREGPHCDFSYPLIHGIWEGLRDWVGITATTLLGCPVEKHLSWENDVYAPLESLMWAFRGQLFHDLMETHGQREAEDAMVEVRQSRMVIIDGDEVEISGQPDLVIPSKGVIRDHKTTRSIPRDRFSCSLCGRGINPQYGLACKGCHTQWGSLEELVRNPGRMYDNHRRQLLIYRWLMAGNGIGPLRCLQIQYLDMSKAKLITMPQEEVASLQTIEAAIVERARPLHRALAYGEIPPAMDPDWWREDAHPQSKDRYWQCPKPQASAPAQRQGYCNVSHLCHAYHESGLAPATAPDGNNSSAAE